jgi:LysM repeat protein
MTGIYNIMDLKLCDEFYYRISDENVDIYKTFNTSPENVLRNNPKIKLYVGEWIKIRKNNYIIHHVKPMETLDKIAKQYNIDKVELKKQNSLSADKLFIGQQIKIFDDKK